MYEVAQAGNKMHRVAAKKEAEKFIEQFGLDAYAKAEEAMRNAHRRKNVRRAEFLAKVMRHIGKRSALPPSNLTMAKDACSPPIRSRLGTTVALNQAAAREFTRFFYWCPTEIHRKTRAAGDSFRAVGGELFGNSSTKVFGAIFQLHFADL